MMQVTNPYEDYNGGEPPSPDWAGEIALDVGVGAMVTIERHHGCADEDAAKEFAERVVTDNIEMLGYEVHKCTIIEAEAE